MPDREDHLALLVHPHQLEVQEFSSYALVVDARSKAEFDEDHVPFAVSIPVGLHSGDGHSVPSELTAHTSRLKRSDPILVYCGRGGLDSLVWADPLRREGRSVDVLPGGWITYRRWVTAGLEILPRSMRLLRLCGAPGSATKRVLDALRSTGQQVIDFLALCDRPLAPGVPLCVGARMSQGAFESHLLDALRTLDVGRDVWIDGGGSAFSTLHLPPALRQAMDRARMVVIEVPLSERAHAWAEDLDAVDMDGEQLIRALAHLKPQPTRTVVDDWRQRLADSGVESLLATLTATFLDRRFGVPCISAMDGRMATAIQIDSLAVNAVAASLSAWQAQELEGSPGGSGSIKP